MPPRSTWAASRSGDGKVPALQGCRAFRLIRPWRTCSDDYRFRVERLARPEPPASSLRGSQYSGLTTLLDKALHQSVRPSSLVIVIVIITISCAPACAFEFRHLRRPEGAALLQPRATPWGPSANTMESPEGAVYTCVITSCRTPFQGSCFVWIRVPRALPWAVLEPPLRGSKSAYVG